MVFLSYKKKCFRFVRVFLVFIVVILFFFSDCLCVFFFVCWLLFLFVLLFYFFKFSDAYVLLLLFLFLFFILFLWVCFLFLMTSDLAQRRVYRRLFFFCCSCHCVIVPFETNMNHAAKAVFFYFQAGCCQVIVASAIFLQTGFPRLNAELWRSGDNRLVC